MNGVMISLYIASGIGLAFAAFYVFVVAVSSVAPVRMSQDMSRRKLRRVSVLVSLMILVTSYAIMEPKFAPVDYVAGFPVGTLTFYLLYSKLFGVEE